MSEKENNLKQTRDDQIVFFYYYPILFESGL